MKILVTVRQCVRTDVKTLIATCYADATLAKEELGWEAENGIEEMCADSWRWQSNNPNGYGDN